MGKNAMGLQQTQAKQGLHTPKAGFSPEQWVAQKNE